MSEQSDYENDIVILVDFGDGKMKRVTNDDDIPELNKESQKAVQKAFDTVKWVAKQATNTLDNLDKLHQKPDEMELEFGIAITTKAGVLVMQGEAEFHIKAKLVWKKESTK